LKGCFFGKQRHDDAAKEPNRIALKRALKPIAQRLKRIFITEHIVERIKREHAAGA